MIDRNSDLGSDAEDAEDTSSRISENRRSLLQQAVAEWKKQLVDFSGRNRLIFYKVLQVGTLDLQGCDPSLLLALRSGQEMRLTELFPVLDDDRSQLEDALKRARTVKRTGLANFEERGVNTLFLASHMATWDADGLSSATPNAPVLLAPLEIHPRGGGQTDFDLQLAGEWEINETLLIYWSETFGVHPDRVELDELVAVNQGDLESIVESIEKTFGDSGMIPSLEIEPACVAGNFAYTKLPMVKDLESSIDALAANELIAAIAGDVEAAQAIRDRNSPADVSESLPDTIDLSDEYLILDADSSQSHVINSVLAGKSLIIEGPPGTGKSQTIANLIAALAANGQSTLFVAEKRAAIEAVLKRLEAVGLDQLALDLHSSTIRRKELATSLAASLKIFANIARPMAGAVQAKLAHSRDRLVNYDNELHRRHEPWGHSSFEVNSEILGFSTGLGSVRLDPAVVAGMTEDRAAEIQDTIADWTATRRSIPWESNWVEAPIHSTADAEQLITSVRALLQELLPGLHDAAESATNPTEAGIEDWPVRKIHRLTSLNPLTGDVLAKFANTIWSFDLEELGQRLAQRRRMRPSGPGYRSARKQVRKIEAVRLGAGRRLEFVQRAMEVRREWQALGLAGEPQPLDGLEELERRLAVVEDALRQLGEVQAETASSLSLHELGSILEELSRTEYVALLVGQMAELRAALVGAGCGPIVDRVEQGQLDESDAEAVFTLSCLEGIRAAIDDRNPVLNTFEATGHEHSVRDFQQGDNSHIETAPQRVLRAVAQRATQARNDHPDQDAVIVREARKKTRHKSLRQLRTETEQVLGAIRPCWIMSPLMVAQTLPARACFDYVIFDEASQIRPEEAISAILRGHNSVVAGDPRQLPPSAFFDGGTDGMAGFDGDDGAALTVGYESILDVAAALLPSRMLTWHYRSHDERLIKLSNDYVYDGSLTTFPGAFKDSPITFHKVDYLPRSADEIRSNPAEVAQVVDLMLDHARTRPDESLGVIAFGQHHASAIEEALRVRLLQAADPELDEYFDEDKPERVFVKNIERVQGDERDAIVLSIGYGKDLNGHVPHRFGPVNQQGGERRLNVAASRARIRMAVVSSIEHTDLNTAGLGKGPQLLEALLRFASSGGADSGANAIIHPLNPFELAVKSQLERIGLNPICQYGSSNYRIDFVLPHPSNDGRMALAVEADGASYHSSPTARDRDRLRQEALERLGWRFHRIWSTRFFKDPVGETQRVKDAYEQALRQPNAPVARASTLPEPDQPEPSDTLRKPHLRQSVPIAEHDHRQLVALARWITDDGDRLMTDEELKERMKEELGYKRMGSKISAAFERAIAASKPTR